MTDKKLALMTALVKTYGEGSLVSRKQVKAVYIQNKDLYSGFGIVTRNPETKVGRGTFLLTLKDNVIEQRDMHIAKLTAKKDAMLPANVRESATELAQVLMDTNDDEIDDTATTPKSVMPDMADLDELPDVPDYIAQTDIDEMFGGNDINDIMATL